MTAAPRTPRRTDALSRDRIVAAALEILDEGGEAALTARSITTRLDTGRGAIYHHVRSVDALLAAAADRAIADRTSPVQEDPTDPIEQLRTYCLRLYDVVDERPWVGAQVSRDPNQPAVFRIWKTVGARLGRLGLVGTARADAGSVLVNTVLGAAGQRAAQKRLTSDAAARQAYLDDLAAAWVRDDPDDSVADAAGALRDHDDRAQFAAGVDIVLLGIRARRDADR